MLTIGSFGGTKTIVTQNADLGSFDGTFQQSKKVSIGLPTSGTFYSFWVSYHQTAELVSFDGTVSVSRFLVKKLLTLQFFMALLGKRRFCFIAFFVVVVALVVVVVFVIVVVFAVDDVLWPCLLLLINFIKLSINVHLLLLKANVSSCPPPLFTKAPTDWGN